MITISFKPEQLDYVAQVLNRCPHGEVRGLIDDISAQVRAQQGPSTQPPPVNVNGHDHVQPQ